MAHSWTEAERLAALRAYDILDTESELIFDDFVQIAAEICDAPMALVSLVDEGRQWFAAEKGLGVRQTPIGMSVCAHAMLRPGVFVVPDLAADPQFANNPLVTGAPNLRFYGGAALHTPDGLPLGAMCVLDDKPRPAGLTGRQARTLQALSRQVIGQLELRRAVRQRDEALAKQALLMQEAHHRVKNSLSTVQSLLMLQARATAHPDAAQELRNSAARIRTFGIMHEHLYRVGAATTVDISAYLRSLLAELQAASLPDTTTRSIHYDGPPLDWASAEAPNLGLVIVELVTNALKYGCGDVRVRLRQAGEAVVVSIEDEGGGLPVDFDPAANTGVGMRIINGLLQAGARGRLEIDRSRPCTSIRVTLAIPQDPARGQ
jgi:two-component sensor histidine kinase